MKLDEIQRIVDELDRGILKENARVSLQRYGGDLDEAFIVATERGYLRMGVEFLKAGLTPYLHTEKSRGKRPNEINVDLEYLITEDSDVQFDYFERTENIKIETYQKSWMDKLIPIAVLGVIILILGFALVGLMFTMKAIF